MEKFEEFIMGLKGNGLVIGFANGCFDLFHEGHKHLLRAARQQCDILVVGVNSDESVRTIKGDSRPLNNLEHRMTDVMKSGFAQIVKSFENEEELLQIIAMIKPDAIFKGSDYEGKSFTGEDEIKKYNGKVVFVPLLEGFSTSKMLQ